MATAVAESTKIAVLQPGSTRTHLVSVRAGQAVLDGAWWPRSTDPDAELPGLVRCLDHHFGKVRKLMLHRGSWDAYPRRLQLGARHVRLGWFLHLDPTLLIATTESDDQLDLMVVPVGTAADQARRAMDEAADPANTKRAPELFASVN
jgi:hypothetical protein